MHTIEKGKVYFYTTFENKDTCKSILGGGWSASRKCWVYPIECLPELFKKFPSEFGKDIEKMAQGLDDMVEVDKLKHGFTVPREHPYLFKHQRLCRDIAGHTKSYGYYLDMGTGKTLLSIQIIKDNPDIRWVVVCPKTLIKSAWLADIKKWAPELKVRPLSKNFNQTELSAFHSIAEAQVLIVNPESFPVQIPSKLTQKKIAVGKELEGVTGLIFDESVKLKNPQAQITRKVKAFVESQCEKWYLLSGNPAPNGEEEYFSQMNILDPTVFGTNYFRFRERYFQPCGFGGYEWKFKEELRGEFAGRMSKRCIFIKKKDCLDLPPKLFQVREVELSRESMKYYKQMEKTQILEMGDSLTLAPNKLTQLMKLRQITSGFMLDSEGLGLHLHDDKMDELKEVLEEIGNEQAIIWINFKNEAHAILNMLGDKATAAFSDAKDIDQNIADFRDGKYQYIVAHPQSVKYGVTWVNCHYSIYYSLSYSLDDFDQSQDRMHRPGQNNPCTYIMMLAKETIDEIIWSVLQRKKTIADAVQEIIRRC
jgi:SNF2 family DNA or RNA helicase